MRRLCRIFVYGIILSILAGCGASREDVSEKPEKTNSQDDQTAQKIPKDKKNTTPTIDMMLYESESASPTMPKGRLAGLQGGVIRPNYYDMDSEEYDFIEENGFQIVTSKPLSTFSVDVDAASYGNIRRFINQGELPPKDAVRIEELINYFDYDYPEPDGANPFSISIEAGKCPWNEHSRLVHIGLKGKDVKIENMPESNLVFLLDVSGSMSSPNKLPLVKKAFKLLVKQLRKNDRVAIVTYAGHSGVALESTPGDERIKIINSLEMLNSGGSTAGAEGIELAYRIAEQNFIKGGNNRVILATDGDFNVGPSSDEQLTRIIEEKRKKGIFLTVLGFGMGNLKDSKMEKLADKGNGNYAYIDNILEAKKVFVNEISGTLLTIAKDVKIQVEFNPANVYAYRLIGYENRLLNDEDFLNDKKDAGDIGAGHTVTALYEIIPAGNEDKFPVIEPLKYQKTEIPKEAFNDELLTVKFRYKKPDEDTSIPLAKILKKEDLDKNISGNFKFSAAVAEFGMLLRDSAWKGDANWKSVISLAREARGKDPFGYRAEFIKLAEMGELLVEN